MENEDSDSAQEFNIQPKRLKEDCFNCDVVDWDLTEFEDTADLINNDEALPLNSRDNCRVKQLSELLSNKCG